MRNGLASCLFAVTLLGTSAAGSQVHAIDIECGAIDSAVLRTRPTHVVLRAGSWSVVPDTQFIAAMQWKGVAAYADVYKQGERYAWVRAHMFDVRGKERATELCFRGADGTLARARQAPTLPALGYAISEQAYFTSAGEVIQKTPLFALDDAMLAQTINALPFYAILPK